MKGMLKEELMESRIGEKPKMAICYDFDHTLSPDDMQTFSLIPSFGIDAGDFWSESDALAREHLMDKNLAWMFELVKYSKFKGKSLSRDYFKQVGAEVPLYKGVEEWFTFVNEYAESKGIEVEHYVISSGLKEIIEGTSIAGYFKRIYASSFLYSADGIAEWPAQAVNYTNKTQFVYRINKGVLDVSNDVDLNRSMPDDSKRVPFTNMIYIGDGLSDVPCMKMMRSYGGQAIAVYQAVNKSAVEKLLKQGRVDFIYPADYREGTELETTVKNIIRKMAVSQHLYDENQRQLKQIP